MKLSLNFQTKKRVHLELNDYVIRYIETKHQGLDGVKAIGERYIPSGLINDGKIVDVERLSIILEECVKDWNIKGKHVHFFVPDAYAVVKKVTIPMDIPEDEAKGYLYLQIGTDIHLPFENPIIDIDFLSVNEETQEREVLLFAAPEEIINAYQSLLEGVKLKPLVADMSVLSLYRLYSASGQAKASDHLLCLQFNVHSLNISIFSNHKLSLFRHLRLDEEEDLWKPEKDDQGIQMIKWQGETEKFHRHIQDMINEIERVMNFYRFSVHKGEQGITKIVIAGENPSIGEIEGALKQSIEAPHISLYKQPNEAFSQPEKYYRFQALLGMALKEVD